MKDEQRELYRDFLKDLVRMRIDFSETDQARGEPPPPLQKPYAADARRVTLPGPEDWTIPAIDLETAIRRRESRRSFTEGSLSLDELAYLLWATQGVRRVINPAVALRTVPSAGARHAFETYVAAVRVDGLVPGIYRYLPVEHELLLQREVEDLADQLNEAARGQRFTGEAAATLLWTTVPYRMEWRYDLAAHKAIALDAGHVCQNLYLVCEAIGAGTCAIAAYDQERADRLLEVDGVDEFTLYLAPVGKVGSSPQ